MPTRPELDSPLSDTIGALTCLDTRTFGSSVHEELERVPAERSRQASRVVGWRREERAGGPEATVGHEQMQMRIPLCRDLCV